MLRLSSICTVALLQSLASLKPKKATQPVCVIAPCLQTQNVSDRDAHDQELEGLGRKLTEAEREAAAANVSLAHAVMARLLHIKESSAH